MAVSQGFREYVKEQLDRVTPVTLRSMFGGLGVYSRGLFFALIDDDTLYFKVDDSNRADYETRGMGSFRPFSDDRMTMQYYELPAEVLEEKEALRAWVGKSLAAALKKSRGKANTGSGGTKRGEAIKTPRKPLRKGPSRAEGGRRARKRVEAKAGPGSGNRPARRTRASGGGKGRKDRS